MAVGERDPHTGYLTTGHEWNGITELNTPVPRPVYAFLAVTALFACVYWILMPAWPTASGYTKGLLGHDQRRRVADDLSRAEAENRIWKQRIESGRFEDLRQDRKTMEMVRLAGRTLFGDNCAACHGSEARGGPGFPDLTASSSLWGNDPATLAETIRVGVNSSHPDSRVSQMPAFGRGGMLSRAEIENVVAYVHSLSRDRPADDAAQQRIAAGQAIFTANCAGCHGENGAGTPEVGAPDLTDRVWLYGGDAHSVFTTVWGGRQGHMPTWEKRLSPIDRKILALYLATLRTGAH